MYTFLDLELVVLLFVQTESRKVVLMYLDIILILAVTLTAIFIFLIFLQTITA